MRVPNLSTDSWQLIDGEERHANAPDTFELPSRELREALEPGDFAKLIFAIAIDDVDESEEIERMWVIVRERHGDRYLGVLDNKPGSMAENDSFWIGTELPFEARHIVAVGHANEASLQSLAAPPPIPWR